MQTVVFRFASVDKIFYDRLIQLIDEAGYFSMIRRNKLILQKGLSNRVPLLFVPILQIPREA